MINFSDITLVSLKKKAAQIAKSIKESDEDLGGVEELKIIQKGDDQQFKNILKK